MAVDSNTAFTNTNDVAYPDNESVNASGPTATDGTEFVKVMIDNYMFGPQQALLNYAGIIPDGSPEADGTSQEVDAMKRSFGAPGEAVDWYGDADPATLDLKILLLQGQGILIANYAELTATVYVGDGNNATAPAFYKADDAAGTIRNTAGIYLILPDAQNLYPKFVGETVFSALMPLSGTSPDSESVDWVSSISWSSNQCTINLNTSLLGLTVGMAVALAPMHGGGSRRRASLVSTTSSTIQVNTWADESSAGAYQFGIHAQKQGDDYTIFPTDFIQGGIRY